MTDKIRSMFPELAQTRQRRTRRGNSAKSANVTTKNSGGLDAIYEHFFDMVRNIEQELQDFGSAIEKRM